MKKIIGNKATFAVEIEFIEFTPSIWGKTALWLNNQQVGLFDDENMLGPFLGQLGAVATEYDDYWEPELHGLNCKEMFFVIRPFFGNPEALYDLPYEETEKYVKYDKFILQWGENFDEWATSVVVINNICRFIWFPFWTFQGQENKDFEHGINCIDVSVKDVQAVYKEVCALIPDEYWPSRLVKP